VLNGKWKRDRSDNRTKGEIQGRGQNGIKIEIMINVIIVGARDASPPLDRRVEGMERGR
jgi:hypothetical protein